MHDLVPTQIGNSMGVILPRDALARPGPTSSGATRSIRPMPQRLSADGDRSGVRRADDRGAEDREAAPRGAGRARRITFRDDVRPGRRRSRRSDRRYPAGKARGSAGVRDRGLSSALGRSRNLPARGDPDLAVRAAAYGCGIARDRSFLDGNERSAFVVAPRFIAHDGSALMADHVESVVVMLAVADGTRDEDAVVTRSRNHVVAR